MKLSGVKALSLSAMILQVVAFVVTIGMTLIQSVVKEIFTTDASIISTEVVPVGILVPTVIFLLIYVVGFIVTTLTKTQGTKGKAIAFVVITCVFKVLLQYISFTNVIIARQGADVFAAYSTLESAITLVISPLTLVALVLFCVSCGGYYGMEDKR